MLENLKSSWLSRALARHIYGTMEERVSSLEPSVRTVLAEEVKDSLTFGSSSSSLEEIDASLKEAQKKYKSLQQKEQFIYTRLVSYQKKEKSEEETILLQKISKQHKEMIIGIELYRRKIESIEETKEKILRNLDECEKFVQASQSNIGNINEEQDPFLTSDQVV